MDTYANINMVIKNITDLNNINDVLIDAQKQKIKILNNYWEGLYKNRCPNNYLPLSEIIYQIELSIKLTDSSDNTRFMKANDFTNACFNTLSFLTIHDILDFCKRYNFKQIDCNFRKMICEACVCQNCSYLKEYIGSTCNDCRNNFYNQYQGYCSECNM